MSKGNINFRDVTWQIVILSLYKGNNCFCTEFLKLQLHKQQWRHKRVMLPASVILQGNLIEYYPAREMCLSKWRQRVILLARVMLRGNMIEYYLTYDMLSTNEIFNIANEYWWDIINVNECKTKSFRWRIMFLTCL